MTSVTDSTPLSRDKQRVLRGSILMTLSPVSALFLGLFISYLIELFIPPGIYAIFPWFNLVYTFFGTIIVFKLPMALHYYLAAAKGANQQEELQKLRKTSTILALILAPLSGIITLLAVPILFERLALSGLYSILDIIILSLGITALTFSTFTTATFKGLQEFEKIGIGQFFANLVGQAVVVVLLIVGIGYLGNVSVGIPALLLKWVIVGSLTAILLSISVREVWTLKGETYPLKPLLKFGTPLLISFLFVFFFSELLVVLFLNPFPVELGLYGYATRLANFVNAITLGFYAALGSYYAQSYGKGYREKIDNDVGWTLKISVFLFLPMVVGCMVISPSIFLLLFPNYYWAYQYFIILMFQIVFFFFKKPYLNLLNVTGKTNLNLFIQIVSSVLSGLLMFMFFIYGPVLVAIGLVDNSLLLIVFGYISSNIFTAIFAAIVIKRIFGFHLGLRGVLPILFIGFLIIPPAVLVHLLYLGPLYELALIIPISLCIYLLPIRYLNIISETEIRKATQFLPTRLSTPFANFVVRLFVRKPSS